MIQKQGVQKSQINAKPNAYDQQTTIGSKKAPKQKALGLASSSKVMNLSSSANSKAIKSKSVVHKPVKGRMLSN